MKMGTTKKSGKFSSHKNPQGIFETSDTFKDSFALLHVLIRGNMMGELNINQTQKKIFLNHLALQYFLFSKIVNSGLQYNDTNLIVHSQKDYPQTHQKILPSHNSSSTCVQNIFEHGWVEFNHRSGRPLLISGDEQWESNYFFWYNSLTRLKGSCCFLSFVQRVPINMMQNIWKGM